MNKKKTYIAPAILSTIVCPDLNILAGSNTGSVDSGTGNCQFRDLDGINDKEADGGAFYSKKHSIDVWE